jgi:hypothetical protein
LFYQSNSLPVVLDVLLKYGVIVLLQHLTVAVIVAAISKIVPRVCVQSFTLSICCQSVAYPTYIYISVLAVFDFCWSSALDNCRRRDVMETDKGTLNMLSGTLRNVQV